MNQKIDGLAVSFACPSDVDIGQPVVISDDLTVDAISEIGQLGIVGNVAVHREEALTCTVDTKFRERRDDREAAEAVGIGPFVWDASMNAVLYTKDEFVGVLGGNTGPFTISVAAGGTCTGTVTGTVAIGSAINDKLKVKIGSADPQTVTIAPGPARTMAQTRDSINESAVGFVASVDGSGHIVLTASAITDDLEVQAVTGDCYTALGLSTQVNAHVVAAGGTVTCTNHGALTFATGSKVLKLHVGSGAQQTVTFAEEELAASAIATAINDATDNVVADVVNTDYVRISAYATYDSLTIETSGSTALTVMGLTGGVTHAITPASAGIATGNTTGAKVICDAVNNKVKIKATSGTSATATLTSGARTIDQIFADINTGKAGSGVTASKSAGGYLVLTADAVGDDLDVETVADDAYTTLGIAEDSYAATEQHNKFKVTVGSGQAQTFTLTSGSRSITQIVANFSAATGFTASASSGKLLLSTPDLQDSLTIGSVSGDAYDALGFETGVYDEVWSHDPGAIAGLIIKGTQPLSVTGTICEPFDITVDVNDLMSFSVGGAGSQFVTLDSEDGQSAQDIADTINGTTPTGFSAAAIGGHVVFILDDSGVDFVIEESLTDAYSTLGFTPDTYAAPMGVETLER